VVHDSLGVFQASKGCHKDRADGHDSLVSWQEIRVQKARASLEGPPRTMPSSSSMGITNEVSAEALTRSSADTTCSQ